MHQEMRTFVMVCSVTLLAVGVLGFAFSESFKIPSYILMIDLILGIWGMYTLFKK